MKKELLQKFYPVVILLGLLVPGVIIYRTFFAGDGRNEGPANQRGDGGLNYPAQDASTMVGGKSVTLQSLRDELTSGDSKIQVKAINALGDAGDIYAMPQLIVLLDNKDAFVRARAGVAVQKILGSDYNYKPDLPDAERKKAVENIRAQMQRIMTKIGAAPSK